MHSAWHIVMLGIVGVGTGTVMTAVVMRYILPYDWTWLQSFLFGAIVAATDPVAAVSLLKQVSGIFCTIAELFEPAMVGIITWDCYDSCCDEMWCPT